MHVRIGYTYLGQTLGNPNSKKYVCFGGVKVITILMLLLGHSQK